MSVVAEITNPHITQISLIKKERVKLQPGACLTSLMTDMWDLPGLNPSNLRNLRMSRRSPVNAMQNDPRCSCSLFLICSPWRSQFSSEVAQLSHHNHALRAHRGARNHVEFSI